MLCVVSPLCSPGLLVGKVTHGEQSQLQLKSSQILSVWLCWMHHSNSWLLWVPGQILGWFWGSLRGVLAVLAAFFSAVTLTSVSALCGYLGVLEHPGKTGCGKP